MRKGTGSRAGRINRACLVCGLLLRGAERRVCDTCQSAYNKSLTENLAITGRATLAAMRASADDPARTPEARTKLAEVSRRRTLAIRAWEREHGRVVDRARYEEVILPAIQGLAVPALMALTGLSHHHCWQVRSGRRRLHAMHWGAVTAMVAAQTAKDR